MRREVVSLFVVRRIIACAWGARRYMKESFSAV